ncbi:Anaphase-promoting complex subunit 10 [Madurella mycetomatis]|uniref:Anaphase-promoting complex subunit 10 n=1 Tax=Madurella mycetomatis TaxID=100816 RepID=A0A175VP75_9PEZI|nr:Anaphase-promoting complex subunit 10 [Madurella mycetomatis]
MRPSLDRRVAVPRRVLAELDRNRDLNTARGQTKRAPIIFAQENEDAILEGFRFGTYDVNEVIAWTDFRLPLRIASTQEASNSDDEVTHVADGTFESGELTEAELVGLGEDDDELPGEEMVDEHEQDDHGESEEHLQGPVFDPAAVGLKEINNLAHFGVSSHKPGSGVEELLSEDLDKYWQSDGQQPHLLTIHFLRRVEIRAIRFYVDYNQDESYTPTHIVFYAGTGHHDLIQFAEVPLTNPVGWQDVPIADCGGGPDGHSLCCWIVQMHIKENHQNGKDTHIRGIKIFALDEHLLGGAGRDPAMNSAANFDLAHQLTAQSLAADEDETFQELLDSLDHYPIPRSRLGDGSISNFPAFMRDPEIR